MTLRPSGPFRRVADDVVEHVVDGGDTGRSLSTTGPRAIAVATPSPGGGLSSDRTLTVQLLPSSSVTVNGTSGAIAAAPNDLMTISVANGPANFYDWITVVPVGSSSTTYNGIWFLNASSVPPASGLSSAAFAIPVPSTPGSYEVRFLANGRYQRLATSGVVTVTP